MKLITISVIYTNKHRQEVYINPEQIVSTFILDGKWYLAMSVDPVKEITESTYNMLVNIYANNN